MTQIELRCDRDDCDLAYHRDYEGDPSVPNGTRDFFTARCRTCGAEFPVSAEEALDVQAEENAYDEPEDNE
jgi:hypothetical protein